jgi:hypothetical protein
MTLSPDITNTMKAAVFHKPGKITCDNVPDPRIELATDVILKVSSTAICGSDLHILSGAVPQKEPMVMGHEFMGIVEEVGAEVKKLKLSYLFLLPAGIVSFASTALPRAAKIPIISIMDQMGIWQTKKVLHCLGIPICTAVIQEDKQNMSVYHMRISARV